MRKESKNTLYKENHTFGFQGIRSMDRPSQWNHTLKQNLWLDVDELSFDDQWNEEFYYVMHNAYQCFEFKRPINILTFGKIKWMIPLTMIALPVSIDGCGYEGSLEALIKDYRLRKGLFLLLNIPDKTAVPKDTPIGATLGTCIFHNRFVNFDSYMKTLRSHYRRRIQVALKKSSSLTIKKIDPSEFDQELYETYLQVLKRSKYPLETLPIEYFQKIRDEIYVFFEGERKIAFVAIKNKANKMYFLFGGMLYEKLKGYDLYYSMLIFILKQGIERGVEEISFGQTAESSKGRLGCIIDNRYMSLVTKHPLLNRFFQLVMPMFEYRQPEISYSVFKE